MPPDPTRAIGRILDGSQRSIDVGDIDGHPFVNVAGVGFDAHIAGAFAAIGRARRGFLRYGAIVIGQLRTYECRTYTAGARSSRRLRDDDAPRVSADLCQRASVGQRGHHRAVGRARRRRAGGGGRGGPGPRGGVASDAAVVRGHHRRRAQACRFAGSSRRRSPATARFCTTRMANRMSAVRRFESRSGPGHCDSGPDRADPPESFTHCLQSGPR